MRLIALEIPDDATDLPGWLEDRLVGLDLSALVAELEAVHGRGAGSAGPPLSIDTILGKEREAVLAHGLASLPADRLRQLLRHPRLLLDLQELILSSGRPYWHRRAESALERDPTSEQQAAIDRDWAWLAANVIEDAPKSAPARDQTVQAFAAINPAQQRPRSRWRSHSLAWLAAAAAVLLAFFTVYRWPGRDQKANVPPGDLVASPSAWGWNRSDALPQDLPRDAYLNHLADAAHSWFNKRPEDRTALAQRITEFRQGCTVLIQSPHKPLPAADRTWLVDKCRAWATKLGTHLAELESGQAVIKVRDEADETINKLITALRERARGVA
jgi:hypothetical protein